MIKPLKIKYSDLDLLTKIFTGSAAEIYVFDPKGKVQYDELESNQLEVPPLKVLFNFGEDLKQYKQFDLSEFDQIIDFGSISKLSTSVEAKFKLVQSSSKELKWIFSPNDRKQSFLGFLAESSLRARLIKAALKLFSKAGLSSFFSYSFKIYSKNVLYCTSLYENELTDSFSIYCGVPGVLRKPVIQFTSKGKALAFVKFAISKSSLVQIEQEGRVLRRLSKQPIEGIRVPKLLESTSELALSTAPLYETKGDELSNKRSLYRAIKAISSIEVRHNKISFLSLHRQFLDQISWISSEAKQFSGISKKLKQIQGQVSTNDYVYTSLSHGDFAPWNLKNGAILGVFDWEMAQNERPLLYDFFHYNLMNEILVKRELNAFEIIKKIKAESESPKIKYLIKHYRIDFNTHFNLYLLHNISKQLVLFEKSKSLSADHQKLLTAWNEILDELLPEINLINQRLRVLSQFEKFMADMPYVAMKFLHPSFSSLSTSSDLDLALPKHELNSVVKFFKSSCFVDFIKVEKLGHMSVLKIFLKNGQFLAVDLIHEFSRKGSVYLDIEMMIKEAVNTGTIKRPNAAFELAYLQAFYFLNGKDIPEKYRKYMSVIFEKDVHKMAALTLSRLYLGIEQEGFEDLFKYSDQKKRKIKQHIKIKFNEGFSFALRRSIYLLKNTKSLIIPKGKVITFSGVDGAGKTTVINEVTALLKGKYRKEIVYLRHRPGVLPILSALKHGSREKAEKVSSESLPRRGTNKSKLSSFLRFSYYYIDYLLGQIVVRNKYLSRGKIVIYDRYYFDFINDPKRSNINLNRSFIKRMYAFVSKPDFNFYLYNDPKIILQRKKELSKEDIIELNANYKSLFDEYNGGNVKGKYIQLKNEKLTETVDTIMNQLKKIA